jgi:transcriptional regulator with XRE-family HTH domain
MLKLRAERERRGWSQTFLSGLTGIAQSDLSAFENERRQAGAGQRQRLARAFGLPEAELFVRAEEVGRD